MDSCGDKENKKALDNRFNKLGRAKEVITK